MEAPGGTGLVVAGWIMVGVGLLSSILLFSAADDLDNCDEDFDEFDFDSCESDAAFAEVLTTVGTLTSVVGGAGLVMAVTGHIVKGAGSARQRRWDEKYGGRVPARSGPGLVAGPAGGLGFSFSF